jgi:hypothetical protein
MEHFAHRLRGDVPVVCDCEVIMGSLLAGSSLLVTTAVLFRWCLPRNGKLSPLVGTAWEPYVAVAFATGATIGAGFVVLGLTQFLAGA